ncbi:MAG: hypothetical protein AB2L14_22305 [Candidatus Xenobiia bacterium LiM19]
MSSHKSSLLLCSLGASWMVVAEAFYFLNMKSYDFYSRHPERAEFEKTLQEKKVEPVSKLWIITSDGGSTKIPLEKCRLWWETVRPENGELRMFVVAGSGEVASIDENELIGEAIMRVALLARDECRKTGSKFYLSLAGGRKTMSTFMQKACNVWGADLSLHIVGDTASVPKEIREAAPQEWRSEHDVYTHQQIATISPMFLTTESAMDEIFNDISSSEYPLTGDSEACCVTIRLHDTALLDLVDSRFGDMKNISVNILFDELRGEHHENFRSLYRLPRETIMRLRNERIGKDSARSDHDLAFICALPKADLHCHLGGAASAEDLIIIAETIVERNRERCSEVLHVIPFIDKVCELINLNAETDEFFKKAEKMIKEEWSATKGVGSEKKPEPSTLPGILKVFFLEWCGKLPEKSGIKAYHAAAAFLSLFKDKAHLLTALIYGSYGSYQAGFRKVSLKTYMELGDLGGSMLLQTSQALRKAVILLCRKAHQDGVRYLEIRCSPANYLDGDMSLIDVIETLISAAKECSGDILVNYIFSATRHKDLTLMSRQIASAVLYSPQVSGKETDLSTDELKWEPRVVGFDLAGKETPFSPSEFKSYFLPLFRNYLKITIHAGEEEIGEAEEQSLENIWEAIYELHADRIGHGLKLSSNPSLLEMIKDRQIAIELCPSSNYQTQLFRDFLIDGDSGESCSDEMPCYPLRDYYDKGLNITINTDNWGISKTTLSEEYLKASRMTVNGLTRWEVLSIVKAGLKSAFLPFDVKERLIKEADKAVFEVVRKL